MSVYKIIIWKDMAPQNKNTSHFHQMQCCAKSIVCEGLSAQKKAPIWECFFAFTMCRENTYISWLLAMIFFHKTESIIFISNFIIKKIKIVHFHHM